MAELAVADAQDLVLTDENGRAEDFLGAAFCLGRTPRP